MKSHLCNPFLGIAPPQSQFPHSWVCERFIYSEDRSTYFLQQNRQIDHGNILIAHRHMNLGLWPCTSISRNIYFFEFLVLVLCSSGKWCEMCVCFKFLRWCQTLFRKCWLHKRIKRLNAEWLLPLMKCSPVVALGDLFERYVIFSPIAILQVYLYEDLRREYWVYSVQ